MEHDDALAFIAPVVCELPVVSRCAQDDESQMCTDVALGQLLRVAYPARDCAQLSSCSHREAGRYHGCFRIVRHNAREIVGEKKSK